MNEEMVYIIVSGEGHIDNEFQFVGVYTKKEQADEMFEKFKQQEFAETELRLYKAVQIKEQ